MTRYEEPIKLSEYRFHEALACAIRLVYPNGAFSGRALGRGIDRVLRPWALPWEVRDALDPTESTFFSVSLALRLATYDAVDMDWGQIRLSEDRARQRLSEVCTDEAGWWPAGGVWDPAAVLQLVREIRERSMEDES